MISNIKVPNRFNFPVFRNERPLRYKRCQKGVTEKLGVIQNKCLRVVVGAYRAIPVEVPHAETATLPMQEYLDLLQIKARSRLRLGGQAAFIEKQCGKLEPSYVNAQ